MPVTVVEELVQYATGISGKVEFSVIFVSQETCRQIAHLVVGTTKQNGTSVLAITSLTRSLRHFFQTNSTYIFNSPLGTNIDFVMKKNNILILTALATTALTPNIGYSQETNANDTDDIIIVTANRRPQPLSQVGSSVSVITSDDLERNQQTFVLDALESIPGVSTSQNGSFGGTASVSIRGAGGDRSVLMVDGVQLNDPSSPGGAFNFGTLDTNNIERVEVLRGPQSTLYGSDAIGGVINIVTKTGQEGLGGQVFVEGGSFNTQRAGASLRGGYDRFGFNVSASGINTDGISAADENDGNTERDGLRSYAFNGKFTGELSEIFQLEAITRYSDNETQFDAFGPSDGTVDKVSNVDEFSGALRGHLDLLEGNFANTLSAEYTDVGRLNLDDDFTTFIGKGKRINFDYLGVYEMDSDWTATGGLQHEAVKFNSESYSTFSPPTLRSSDYISTNSVFGEIAFTGVSGLVLTGGVRYDDHETFGDKTSFRATASYEIDGTGTRLIANWGEGFKAPSVFQLIYVDPAFGPLVPASDLRPEKSRGYEIGIEQSLVEDRVIINATYFHFDIDDAIDFVFNPFPALSDGYRNVDQVNSKGFEINGQFEVTETLYVTANYTYTDAKDSLSGASLRGEPKNLFSGSIIWQPTDKISTTLNVVYNGQELISNGDFTDPLDAWTRVDLRASYEIMDGLSVYGRVDNLFNEEYQFVRGYGTPDRSYFAGLRKTF